MRRSEPAPPSARRVVLHVGLPSAVTAEVQRRVTSSASLLEARGVRVASADAMLHAALDVRGNHQVWGRARAEVAGTWDAVCADARRHPGTSLLAHEVLAGATRRQVASALTMLKGLDLHVVVTQEPVRGAEPGPSRAEQVLDAWARRLSPARVHVLADSDADALWSRFAALLSPGHPRPAGWRRAATAGRTPHLV